MEKLILLSFLLIVPLVSGLSTKTVYVCNNGKTAVFHTDEDCPALKRCTYQRLELTMSQAKGRGLRVCAYRAGCNGQE